MSQTICLVACVKREDWQLHFGKKELLAYIQRYYIIKNSGSTNQEMNIVTLQELIEENKKPSYFTNFTINDEKQN